tara:strand:+ start:1040 stop:2368 length:1329 start_codon:yes stop_codon:yes gene_type:complete
MKSIYLFLFSALIFISCSTDIQPSVLEKASTPAQEFFIDSNSDTLLYGKEGTVVFIEKGSLVNYYGETVTDSVVVTLKELYKTSDMLTSDVTMRSGNKILETGGMIELQAYSKGEQLEVDYDKSIVVHFPKQSQTDSMRLFYGSGKSHGGGDSVEEYVEVIKNDMITWSLEESSVPKIENRIQYWYTDFDDLDDSSLYLSDGRSAYDTIKELFNFSQKEKEYFLNKTSKVQYDIDKEGKLHYDEVDGSVITKKMERKLANVVKLFPLCKPYTVKGELVDMPGHFQIWSEIKPAKFLSNNGYLKQIEKKMSSSDTSKSAISVAELQYYIFDSKQLGWMNCDQFINPNPIKEDFVVSVPKSENIFVKIIFKNYKTIMIGDEEKGKFTFKDLPIDEPVKVVVIDEKDGKPLLKITDTKTSGTAFKIETLDPVSLSELQEKLKELD